MAVDAGTFPRPRTQRAGPTPLGLAPPGAGPPAPPITRIFPFSLRAASATRSTAASPRIRGPSLIRSLYVSRGGAPVALRGILLGKATTEVTEDNVAIGTATPYTPLFDGLPSRGSAAGTPDNTTGLLDQTEHILHDGSRLDIIVLDPEWHLTVTLAQSTGVSAGDVVGYVVVLEGVNPEALANFL